jgi:hypothetical protein
MRGRAEEAHRTVSIGEKTGIQAQKRIAPDLPIVPGKVERHEFECRRHGTRVLIAAFDVTIGKVEGVIGDTHLPARVGALHGRLLRLRLVLAVRSGSDPAAADATWRHHCPKLAS